MQSPAVEDVMRNQLHTRGLWPCKIAIAVALALHTAAASSAAAASSGAADPGAPGAPAPPAAPRPGGFTVWVQPVPIALGAAGGVAWVPIGVAARVAPGWQLGATVAPTVGNWYGCGSTSRGVFLSLAASRTFAPWESARHGASGGLVAGPRAYGRLFDTRGGSASNGWFGCSESDVRVLDGLDGEVGVGATVGYEVRWRSLYLASVVGAGGGVCVACTGDAPWPGGLSLPFSSTDRHTRFAVGLDLELVRLGLTF